MSDPTRRARAPRAPAIPSPATQAPSSQPHHPSAPSLSTPLSLPASVCPPPTHSTDEQRTKEDEEFRKQRTDYGAEKGQWKYLQKYYHKGAYFQDEDESGNAKMGAVMQQDFGAATGKDALGDTSAMPAPMQVKNFGMRSQVKWTHLTAEDPSTTDALWAGDRQLTHKYKNRMAGYKDANDFDRPSAKRKKGAGSSGKS